LTNGYFYHVPNMPEYAFQYASRCLEHYDGGKVKHGIMDQYARALLRLGGFNTARMALRYALFICPGFKQSETLLQKIDELEKGQIRG
ncbi:MAG: hypothetical protein PHT59_07460, partial [Candidatus Omnitrophica bacterium]|nr:hypothetical protein [Candidatus Omnitrophota bacterium]